MTINSRSLKTNFEKVETKIHDFKNKNMLNTNRKQFCLVCNN